MSVVIRDLDITSRAAVSIVGDWVGPIVSSPEDCATHEAGCSSVRSLWTIDELARLLVSAVEKAHEASAICKTIDTAKVVDNGEADNVVSTLGSIAASLQRLRTAVRGAISIIDLFESQSVPVRSSVDLRACVARLEEIIGEVDDCTETLGWADLNKRALPSEEFKQLTAYLIETGKASA